MQSFLVLSAVLTFALWVQDGVTRYSAGSWQSAPLVDLWR